MAKIPAPYFQHRHTVGHFNQIQNKKQPSQKQQKKRCEQLAARPGLHRDNIHRQIAVHAMVHLLTVLSSIKNTDKMIDVVPKNRNRSEMGSSEYENTERGTFILNPIQNDNITLRGFVSAPDNKEWLRSNTAREIAPMKALLHTSDADSFTFTSVMEQMMPVFIKGLDTLIEPIVTVWHNVDHLLTSYDPLKFPGTDAKAIQSHTEGVSSDSKIHLRHSHSVSPEIKRENQRILHYLFEHGYSNETLSHRQVLVSVISTYLFGSDASSMLKRPEEIRVFARRILAAHDLYGGKEEETLSLRQAESVFSYWMFHNVLNMEPEDYITRKIAVDKYPEYFSVGSLQFLLSPETLRNDRQFHLHKVPETQWDNFCRMWFFCLYQKMPFLKLKEIELKDISLFGEKFAALYAGSRFLDEATDRGQFYTLEEAIQVGEKMWDIALSEEVTADKIRYFRVPSLFFMAKETPKRINQEKNLGEMGLVAINEYLQYQEAVEALHKNVTQKYENYQSAVGAWMSKETLADNVASELSLKDLYFYFPKLRTIQDKKDREEFVRFARSEMKKSYLEIGSLNQKYHTLTSNVADSFCEIDTYLIELALLKENELHFIFSSDAVLHPVFFNMYLIGSGDYPSYFGMHHEPKDVIYARLAKTDLISVIVKGEERIYALKANQNIQEGYQLIQVDRGIRRYIEANLLDYKGFGSNYNVSGEKVITNKGEFIFNIRTEMGEIICKDGKISKLIEFLSKKHRKELYDSLYESGDYETSNEKTWNIVKHIIPFYDCIEGIIHKDHVQAVPSCFLDTASFIPVIGGAASLSERFGMSLAKGIVKGGMALRKHSLSIAATTTLRKVSLPTRSELISLGKTALQSADPGIELLTGVSKKLSEKVALRLLSDKKSADLAKKIKSVDYFEHSPSGAQMQLKTAILPGSKMSVSTKKIGHDGMDDIYAQVDPDTGEIFGYRYTIDEKNTLVRRVNDKAVLSKTNTGEIGRAESNVAPVKPLDTSDVQLIPSESKIKLSPKETELLSQIADVSRHVKDTTSKSISKELEKRITPEMYEKNIDEDLLSPPDEYGLSRNTNQDTFLKVKDGYIKINKLNGNRFVLGPAFSHRTVLRFKHDQFFVETTQERLQNILDVGLSGRGAIKKAPNLEISASSIEGSEIELSSMEYKKLLSEIWSPSVISDVSLMTEPKIQLTLVEFNKLVSKALGLPNLKIGDSHKPPYEMIHMEFRLGKLVKIEESEVKLSLMEFNKLLSKAMDLPNLKTSTPSIGKLEVKLSLVEFNKLVSKALDLPNLKIGSVSMEAPKVDSIDMKGDTLLSEASGLPNSKIGAFSTGESEVKLSLMEFSKVLSKAVGLPHLHIGFASIRQIEVKFSLVEFNTLLSEAVGLPHLKIGSVSMKAPEVSSIDVKGDTLLSEASGLPNSKIGAFSIEGAEVKLSLMELNKLLSKAVDWPNLNIGASSIGKIEVKLPLVEFNKLVSKAVDLPNLKVGLVSMEVPKVGSAHKKMNIEEIGRAEPKMEGLEKNHMLAEKVEKGVSESNVDSSRWMPSVKLSLMEFNKLVSEAVGLSNLKTDLSLRGELNIEFPPMEYRKLLSKVFNSPNLKLDASLKAKHKIKLTLMEFHLLVSDALDLPNLKISGSPRRGFEVKLPYVEFNTLLSKALGLPNLKVGFVSMKAPKIDSTDVEMDTLLSEAAGLPNSKVGTSSMGKIEDVSHVKDTSSRYISKELEKRITPEMYEKNINADLLSAPDEYGLRRNMHQDTFLKVRGGYIKINKLNGNYGNRFLLGPTFSHRRIVLRFKHDQFFVETTRERLQNILDMGLSGRGRIRKEPLAVLKEVDGFTEKSATMLLSEYQFPEKGFYDAYSFALQIEQTNEIPVWAERFRKIRLSEQHRAEISETVMRVNPKLPGHTIPVHLGKILGEGSFGTVFLDAEDTRFVFKRFDRDKFRTGLCGEAMEIMEKMVLEESKEFISYYGPGAAMVFRDINDNVYIRMYNLPGEAIESLGKESLPADAIERFVDMLEKMNEVGIWHGDLHSENIFWDSESRMFYPLDIHNIKEDYFTADVSRKSTFNLLDGEAWQYLVDSIKEKMKKPIDVEVEHGV